MINIIRSKGSIGSSDGAIAPRDIKGIALSGGVDSMALLSFLRNEQRPRWIEAFFFDHSTQASQEALNFVTAYCGEKNISLTTGKIRGAKPAEESWEEYWRNQRYGWLHKQKRIIATAHHLNDVAETYIWGMAHGHPRIIHYRKPTKEGNGLIVRPLLLTPKQELYDWCHRHNVPYIEDKSNKDLKFTRNRIRHEIMPQMLRVNPGFLKVMARKVQKEYEHGYY
jgi:tRNA(Ile)-lysidine synthase